jgi:hypothetical protein
MLNKRWWQAHRIRFTESVCKPPEGAVFKRYGAERSGKDAVQASSQVSVKKLNESKPTDEVSKRLLVVKSIEVQRLIRLAVADNLFTGCRTTGIKVAGTLHRLLFGT